MGAKQAEEGRVTSQRHSRRSGEGQDLRTRKPHDGLELQGPVSQASCMLWAGPAMRGQKREGSATCQGSGGVHLRRL